MSEATLYGWKIKYGGMEVNEAQRLKSLEDENHRLKQLNRNQFPHILLDQRANPFQKRN